MWLWDDCLLQVAHLSFHYGFKMAPKFGECVPHLYSKDYHTIYLRSCLTSWPLEHNAQLVRRVTLSNGHDTHLIRSHAGLIVQYGLQTHMGTTKSKTLCNSLSTKKGPAQLSPNHIFVKLRVSVIGSKNPRTTTPRKKNSIFFQHTVHYHNGSLGRQVGHLV